MATVNNTVNDAASAIVSAQYTVQPTTTLLVLLSLSLLLFRLHLGYRESRTACKLRSWALCSLILLQFSLSVVMDELKKKRWWSLYWCFGPHKNSKKIGNAVLVPEPVEPICPVRSHPATAPNPSTAIVMPFIVPPSSPSSFLQSDPPSATQSPAGLFSLSSLAINASGGPPSIFAIGPYAYETYPGTQLISPRSIISTSGSSTPFPDRHHVLEFHKEEAPKLLSFEPFSKHKWISNLGSGSLTPYSAGKGSRLGSGSVTPDTVKLTSQLGSGCLTPDGLCQDLRLGSGSLTPDGVAPTVTNDFYVGKQISEVTLLSKWKNESQSNAALVDHRVSFELTGEDVARCLVNKSGSSLLINMSGSSQGTLVVDPVDRERIQKNSNSCCDLGPRKSSNDESGNSPGEGKKCCRKHHSFNSSKEFNFDSSKGGVSDNPANGSEWWTNKKFVGKEGRSSNSWAFFPMLHSLCLEEMAIINAGMKKLYFQIRQSAPEKRERTVKKKSYNLCPSATNVMLFNNAKGCHRRLRSAGGRRGGTSPCTCSRAWAEGNGEWGVVARVDKLDEGDKEEAWESCEMVVEVVGLPKLPSYTLEFGNCQLVMPDPASQFLRVSDKIK
ncbi:hypothetical protein VNO78_19760 [Psophocarpus tetragonolobus]|uniref:Uncharacterized protein n=1 Tax=Psophocarpus tetragonolobus TaxID=3891 RepID=A0AAN9XGJ0_PSOTE